MQDVEVVLDADPVSSEVVCLEDSGDDAAALLLG